MDLEHLADRDSVLGSYTGLGDTFSERLVGLSFYMNQHCREVEIQEIIRPLLKSVDECRANKKRLLDAANLNIKNLLLKNDEGLFETAIRRPVIGVNYEITSRGNLKLSLVQEQGFSGDIHPIERGYSQHPPGRPSDEILFLRGVDDIIKGISSKNSWVSAFNSEVMDTYLALANEVISDLEGVFDVRLCSRPKIKRDRDNGKIRKFEIISRNQAQQEREEAEERWRIAEQKKNLERETERLEKIQREKKDKIDRLDSVHAAKEVQYGLSAVKIVGVSNVLQSVAKKMPTGHKVEILISEFGMKRPESLEEFKTDYRAMCVTLRRNNQTPDETVLSPSRAKELVAKVRKDFPEYKWSNGTGRRKKKSVSTKRGSSLEKMNKRIKSQKDKVVFEPPKFK